MPTFGLSSTGFLIPTLEEIRDAINQELVDAFGASIDLTNGILARVVAILAERLSLLWEQLEAVYNSQSPDTASGFALDALGLLRGALRIESKFSTVTLTLTGTPGTLIPTAQQTSTASNGGLNKFQTAAPGTIIALAAWVTGTVYAVGDRRTNASKCYQAIVGGTSGVTGPTTGTTGVSSTTVDGTVTWLYLGDGTGVVDVAGQSLLKDAILGAARDIIKIDQPVGGWSGVINVLDAVPGFLDQNDESFRITQEEELAQAGTSTADAIQAALLALEGVTAVTVFHNDTDTTDVNGITPHTVLPLVTGGADADIGVVLLAQVAAGIQTQGNVTTTPVDAAGVTQPMKFSRPAVFDIGVAITLIKVANNPADKTTYPLDGDAQVKAAIVAFGNAQRAGKDVTASSLSAQAFKVPGVLDVTATLIISTPSPGVPGAPVASTTIPISLLQRATFDTSWITVTSSNGTP